MRDAVRTTQLAGALAAAADKRAEATYDADAVLHEAVKIQEHLAAQDTVLDDPHRQSSSHPHLTTDTRKRALPAANRLVSGSTGAQSTHGLILLRCDRTGQRTAAGMNRRLRRRSRASR